MKFLIAVILLSALFSSVTQAQITDTTRTRTLETIVVTAERVSSALSTATAGVSVLSASELRDLPHRNASHLLGFLPGMTFLDFDGLGFAPQSVSRGFYGGGEAEYVVVLINGKPINNLENGLINWDQITSSPSTVIEVLRGGASSLYGDAAIGAVMNIRTGPIEKTSRLVRASTGTFGIGNAHASIRSNRYSALADYKSSSGFRDHSKRTSGTFIGSYKLVNQDRKTLSLSGALNIRDYDTPGPLFSNDPASDGSPSLAFFRFDGVTEQTFRASLEGDWQAVFGIINATLTGELRDQELIRTIPLSPDFADTQERRINTVGLKTGIQISDISLPLPVDNQVVAGWEGTLGQLDTRYHHIETGGLDTYLDTAGDRGEMLSDGTVTRYGSAGYLQFELNPTPRIKVSLGARMDWLKDSADVKQGVSEPPPSSSHFAFSPKAGLNVRYLSSATQVGNVYVSTSRSFKAPTLDQLYDLRAFPVPFPPFSIQISNADLIPQFGTNYEIGFYHRVAAANGWSAMLSSSVYTIDMKDEIDFSFETFSNVNIGKSRHQGVELGVRIEKDNVGSTFLNYTLQDVTSRVGENRGNAVKAIPRHAISGGVIGNVGSLSASIVVKGNRKMYVDDSNSRLLPNYATVDARVSFTRNDYTLTLDVFNALDKQYNSTAYPDPAGSETLFVFPAAARTVSVGIELRM